MKRKLTLSHHESQLLYACDDLHGSMTNPDALQDVLTGAVPVTPDTEAAHA
ncbi:hypothetical protein [Chrysiogenes arsenatis]|uniref:hypothetical protein n=1 Tax=Chrysiogenes arsenatis TaxID=309797 RepID=UPI00040FDBB0|nr:hypothetical protein [Chrysiogenes arsenatis]